MIPAFCILNLCLMLVHTVEPHEDPGLTYISEYLDQYCDMRQATEQGQSVLKGRVGKAGPAGPPGPAGPHGPPGIVNHTAVEEMIEKKLIQMTMRRKTSCMDLTEDDAKIWHGTGGIFDLYPILFGGKMEVYCDVTTDGGGWMVFQRRMDGSEDFNRPWAEYVDGFGDINKEFWIGLEDLHQITSVGEYELHVDLKDWSGNAVYAVYSDFSIGNSASKYQLKLGAFEGTSGDSMNGHRDMKFSTADQDNDKYHGNCASGQGGGWWFNACDASNLNGNYKKGGTYTGAENGVEWSTWKRMYSMKFTEMKFRPKL